MGIVGFTPTMAFIVMNHGPRIVDKIMLNITILAPLDILLFEYGNIRAVATNHICFYNIIPKLCCYCVITL